MNNYEAMIIIRPDLSEDQRKALCAQIQDAVTKNSGTVSKMDVWSEKRRLTHSIKKFKEGVYYLMAFQLPAEAIVKIRYTYKLNEDILRVLISRK